jgi:hypothetical protein
MGGREGWVGMGREVGRDGDEVGREGRERRRGGEVDW